MDKNKELAEAVMRASLNWTGDDEVKNPDLKLARTLAGLILMESKSQPDDDFLDDFLPQLFSIVYGE